MKIFSTVFAVILIFISCKNGDDVFATTDSGNITRAEFDEWLESRKVSAELMHNDKVEISYYLKQLAVEKLTAEKAEISGYNNDKSYLIIENNLFKNLLSTTLIEHRSNKVTFNDNAVDISIIRLFHGKNIPGRRIRSDGEISVIINSILLELKAGKNFNELAERFSDDISSYKGGRIGVVPESMIEDEIKNAVSILSENQYTEEPVITGNSLCLIQLNSRFMLNEKNIQNRVTDKENRDRIITFYKKRFFDQIRGNILEREKIYNNIDTVLYGNSEAVVFSIDRDIFTVGELNVLLYVFYSLKCEMPPPGWFSIDEKKITSESIFDERLFASEALKNSIGG